MVLCLGNMTVLQMGYYLESRLAIKLVSPKVSDLEVEMEK